MGGWLQPDLGAAARGWLAKPGQQLAQRRLVSGRRGGVGSLQTCAGLLLNLNNLLCGFSSCAVSLQICVTLLLGLKKVVCKFGGLVQLELGAAARRRLAKPLGGAGSLEICGSVLQLLNNLFCSVGVWGRPDLGV